MTDGTTKKHGANITHPTDHRQQSSEDAKQGARSPGRSQASADSDRPSTGRRRHKRFLARGIVEYERDRLLSRVFKRGAKATGLLLNISRGGLQFLVGHHLKKGDKLLLDIKIEGIYDSISLKAEVKWAAKVLTQDSYRIGIEFVQYTTIAEKKLRGLEAEYLPRQHKLLAEGSRDYAQKYPILSDYKLGLQGPHADDSSNLHQPVPRSAIRIASVGSAPSGEISPTDTPGMAADATPSTTTTVDQSTSLQSLSGITETGRESESTSSIAQFNEIVEEFKGLEVDDRLIMDVFEAVETGIDLNSLFKSESTSTVVPSSIGGESSTSPRALSVGERNDDERRKSKQWEGLRNLIPVYKLDSSDEFHFDDENRPVGTPVAHIFVSSVQDKESLFACETTDDSMEQSGTPSFDRGNVLMFSTKEKLENGDYAFVKSKPSQSDIRVVFRQIFFDDESSVRLRPLNNKYQEEIYSRQDVELMWKMVGRYEAF